MASTGALWWTTPLQAIATLAAGLNCGASGLQSVLVVPMLQHPSVPAVHSGTYTRDLLHRSDKLFPKVNALSEVINLAIAVTCYLKRNENPAAAAKWPILAGAFACNLATTAYTLTLMVPKNNGMRNTAAKLEKDSSDLAAEKEFRNTQKAWIPGAHVRVAIMLAGTCLGMYSIFLDGKYYA